MQTDDNTSMDSNTALGVIGQVEMGLFGVDAPLEAVNTYHNITNWENTKEHYMKAGLDAIGFFPVVGIVRLLPSLRVQRR